MKHKMELDYIRLQADPSEVGMAPIWATVCTPDNETRLKHLAKTLPQDSPLVQNSELDWDLKCLYRNFTV